MSSKPTNRYANSLTFQILDTFTRDEAVIADDGETREVAYDSGAESDDSLGGRVQKKQHDVTNRKEMIVHLFGKTAAGNGVRVDVKGFKPFFYIRIPAHESRGAAFEAIRRYLKEVKMRPETYELAYEEKELFFGYHRGKKYPFARITVGSTAMFRTLRGCFLDYETSKPALKFGKKLGAPFKEAPEVFEANLDPMLRFFHLRGADPCGWVTIKGVEEPEEDEGIQVECDWADVEPATGAVAPFVVASWDIECFSESGDFPMAKKGYLRVAKDLRLHGTGLEAEELVGLIQDAFEGKGPMTRIQTRGARPTREQVGKWLGTAANLAALAEGCDALKPKDDAVKGLVQFLDATLGRVGRAPLAGDPAIQIGTVLAVAGQPEKTERHCFVWPSCDPVEGVVIHEARTEAEMIKAWGAWMTERDPDILIGYNVFGFDEKYVWDRAEELGVQYSEEIQGLNRLVEDGGQMKLEEKFLSSSAIGDKNLYMWATQGRLRVDVMFYICRSTPLPSYKLDEVTKTYMSGGLVGVERVDQSGHEDELLLQVKGSWGDARPGRYVCLLDETGESLTEKMPILAHKKGELRVRWVGRPEDDIEDEAWKDATQWVIVKDDVSPAELFKLHTGSAADRARVAAYCVQDCDLVLDLYYKLEIFNTSMSMANVCTVPVSYIFTRGQGIKIESLMFKEAYRRGQAVHVLPAPANRGAATGRGEDKYEGAIVLEPTVGLLGAPVGVADFASLYPSTIVSENISHDTLVWVKDYDHKGNYMKTAWTCGDSADYDLPAEIPFTDIEFDLLQADPTDTRKDPRKLSVGKRICRYAQDAKGTVPQIIEGLLAARKATRALIPKETDPLKISLLDAQQNAYKITANSLYGQLGSKTFKLRLQHLAASVTGYGRKQIMFAKAVIERFYGPKSGNERTNANCMAKTVYGDSVVGNTGLFMRQGESAPYTARMDELFAADDARWTVHHDTKEAIDLEGAGLQVWTERGFTAVRRLIRHRLAPGKKLYRILTHTGVVDATEDHSLVRSDGSECRPSEVIVGTELLHNHSQHTVLRTDATTITENEAWVMGFFMADGSADVYDCPSGVKASWAINKSDMALLEQAREKCPFQTKILDTLESSGVYKLVPTGERTRVIAARYRTMFYNEHREKKVPAEIINAPLNIAQAFWNGFYAGDGDKDPLGFCRFDQKGKEVCTGLYLLARKIGYNVSVNDRASKLDVFRLTMTRAPQRKSPTKIKVIRELEHPGEAYVYDFETENHHFAVGPGALVVHNTDSLFVQFNPLNPETGEALTGRESRIATIELTGEAGHLVSQVLKAPHDFEFDKVYDPLLMFSKKLYAGRMFENEKKPDDFVYKYMGISIKRRGNAPLVKTVYGAAMNTVLEKRDVVGAAEIVLRGVQDLVEGRTKMGQLIITKSLKAEYACTPPAHRVLADRIKARDPGNAPAAGDRLPYVYVRPGVGQVAAKLQGERIETPQYVRDKGLVVDYEYYIQHQLKNPISQMFGILLEQMPGYSPGLLPDGWRNLDEDKRIAMREHVAAKLLFGDALVRIAEDSKRAFVAAMGGSRGNGKQMTLTGAVAKESEKMKFSAVGTIRSPGKAPLPAAPKVQTKISDWFADEALLKLRRKKATAKEKLELAMEAERLAEVDA
jgi:DNA polymerase elongation subunit (family B)